MRVLIASPLRSYTAQQSWVEANGATLADVLGDLDRQFPGIRFRMIDEQERMRRHIRFFVNGAQTFDLAQPLGPADELCIVQALSGG
jgi:molybdopterin converting factor small subunit